MNTVRTNPMQIFAAYLAGIFLAMVTVMYVGIATDQINIYTSSFSEIASVQTHE